MTSQDDALYPRPDSAHLLQEGQVLFDSAVGTGDHDSERSHAQPVKGVGMTGRIFHWEIGGNERPPDFPAHLGIISDDEDPAHVVLRKLSKLKGKSVQTDLRSRSPPLRTQRPSEGQSECNRPMRFGMRLIVRLKGDPQQRRSSTVVPKSASGKFHRIGTDKRRSVRESTWSYSRLVGEVILAGIPLVRFGRYTAR